MYGKAQRTVSDGSDISPRNPFELRSALGFGLLYAGVLFISKKAAQTYSGDPGLYVSSLLAGATTITVDAMTNTIVKALLAGWFGGRLLIKYVAPGMIAILATGGLILIIFGFTHP